MLLGLKPTTYEDNYYIFVVNIKILLLSFQQNTPLHTAVKASNLCAVQYLVDKGADVNSRNYCGVSV